MVLNQDFLADLRKRFSGDIRLDLGSRILYSTDASIYQIEPLGVVFPRNTDDLHFAVELAAKYQIPILPRGSGSSLAGQAIGEALIFDCSRWLDRIIDIDVESRTATVEPGVILSSLNSVVAKYGLQFGPDPASADRATFGGIIANNATGAHSILYGMTADHLVSADVIHSDGSRATWKEMEIAKSGADSSSIFSSIFSNALEIRNNYSKSIKDHYPRSWRNSAGYRLNYLLPWSPTKPPQWDHETYPLIKNGTINLATLLAGSEGTLGVISQATISLVKKPEYSVLGILSYDNIAEACDAVPGLIKSSPSAIELIPQLILRLARGVPAYAKQMSWVPLSGRDGGDPQALLIVEFSGDDPEILKKAVGSLGNNVRVIDSSVEQGKVWNIRKVGLGILDSRPQTARPVAFIEDCAIPVEHLGDFVRDIERILSERNVEGGIYAHASAGCLHIRPILDLRTGEGLRYLREIAEQTLALTLRLGGSMTSEHGDGIVRGEWLKKIYGEEVLNAMQALKQAADPKGILNPRKMFDAPPMDTHLRYGTEYKTRAWIPAIDFSRNGGLTTSIEQCNGQGVCRKDINVMCPSFQATRDEKYSTRGRANLLRGLIGQGTGDPKLMHDQNKELIQDVFDALDLCLACKGCKAECPSGVDMAKLKFEFQAEYYKEHRRLFRDYFFGYFHITASVMSLAAPVANLFMNISILKRAVSRIMKITNKRPFPRFIYKKAKVNRSIGRQKVLFLSDPFNHFVEPEVEQAAFDLLNEMEFDVEVMTIIGAGAALLSKGFTSAARRHARHLLDELNRRDPNRTLPIVSLEPSELYFLKNDYHDLLPERRIEIDSRTLKAWLLEEFLLRAVDHQKMRVVTSNQKILFHPHCHQKAERPADDGLANGVNASVELLRHFGFEIELIDAGCCGMAGTFGYDDEHYDLSQKIGNLKLFPKIKSLQGSQMIAATGAACRMQIEQGTGVLAEHPVVLAERAFRQQIN